MIGSSSERRFQFTVRSIFVWMTATALVLGALKTLGAPLPVPVFAFSFLWFAIVAVLRMLTSPKAHVVWLSVLIGILGAGYVLYLVHGQFAKAAFVVFPLIGACLGVVVTFIVEIMVLLCRWVEGKPDDEGEDPAEQP